MDKIIFRKNAIRLLPLLFILYIFNFLNRVNFGYAALEMNQSLSITPQIFGLLSGIFFVGYLILEIPINIVLHKIGARRLMARIVISWGFVSMCCGLVSSSNHLLYLRLLLGMAGGRVLSRNNSLPYFMVQKRRESDNYITLYDCNSSFKHYRSASFDIHYSKL